MRNDNEDYNKRGFGRWSWFQMIDTLAEGDITKFDQVTDLNFILCLNKLSYNKEKAAEDKRIADSLK